MKAFLHLKEKTLIAGENESQKVGITFPSNIKVHL